MRSLTVSAARWCEALDEAAARLGDAGVESPRVDAELLFAHVLGLSRTLILVHAARALAPEAAARLGTLVRRRAAREPLAYLIGSQGFLGLVLKCDRRALVPRWDSEPLVERLAGLVEGLPGPRLADLCTGGGALALGLASLVPRAEVWATDLDPEALALAADNVDALGYGGQVHLRRGHLAQPLLDAGLAGTFDGVLCNPPYVPTPELAGLPPEIRCHEPRLALDGGEDGLEVLRQLGPQAAALLRPAGWLVAECGDEQAEEAMRALSVCGLEPLEVVPDLAGRDR
ncbi:MAG: peptide chain release factor N(5)-glutamine methyltransferase, partial [Armatimonadetes bacterium]|nr:peptide chain release factor N(5)-glutamine methyltransferase [Armatimonadota bacterium]